MPTSLIPSGLESSVLVDPGAAPQQAARRSSRTLWVRVALAVAVLAASAGLRAWQRTQVDEAMRSGGKSPFPLESLPLTLGSWQGKDDVLDPQIARATGAVDRLFRSYIDRRTGVRLSVIVLYGPAVGMAIHSPENCYRAAGYSLVDGPRMRPVLWDDHDLPFRSLTFARGDGGQRDRQHVYYAWRYDGRWSPDLAVQKRIERIAGMYKVHVARAAAESEQFDLVETGAGADAAPRLLRDPCQDFLDLLVPEIERRLSSGASTQPAEGRTPASSSPNPHAEIES